MFAIVQSGGKQYRVSEGDVIRVERVKADAGATVELPVLLLQGENTLLGEGVQGKVVKAEVVAHGLSKKIYVRKYKSGIQYRRRNGHRQQFTTLKITALG
ncbi:50S ribosomal protein L21 [Deinococcus misasensis]|uniref:50S ribosomal protein L21 n=1 Tax=Deinococcus misasensis TaxID=392413 RepID=UPI0009FBAE53|nr:50S ribosomal protein L21 [Deinococcus misasensis]